MSIVKVKTKKVPIFGGSDIVKSFNAMIGPDNVDLDIAYPRYKRIRKICENILKLYSLFADSPVMQRPGREFSRPKEEIRKFYEENADLDKLFGVNLDKYQVYSSATEEDRAAFSRSYESAKKSELIKKFIITCNNLIPYKKFLDAKTVNYKFVDAIPGAEWSPLPFTSLNIKQIFLADLAPAEKIFVITVLSKTLEFSLRLFNEVNSPDIDVDKIVQVMSNNIDRLIKIPALQRCRNAIACIKASMSLLRDNFSEYYKDYLATNDQTIILQNFIADVAKQQSTGDIRIIHEFRTIIDYFKKQSNQVKDKRTKDLVNQLSQVADTLPDIANEEAKLQEDDSGSDTMNYCGVVNLNDE